MFNLEEFKAGVPALTRNGDKKYYIGINDRKKGSDRELITVDDDGDVSYYCINGNFYFDCKGGLDLVDMYREPKKYWMNVYLSEDKVSHHVDKLYESEGQAFIYGKIAANYIKTISFEV